MAEDKKSFKLIEIPLSKFQKDAIPFYRTNYEKSRNNVQKLFINNGEKTSFLKEARGISTIINQLKDLATELVTLKIEVEDSDMTRFKSKADLIYEDISDLICKYNGLQQLCLSRCTDLNEFQDEGLTEKEPYVDLQIQENLEDLKLQEQYNRLKHVENLQENVQNVHEMFANIHEIVDEQSIAVNTIENNIEEAQEDVKLGFREILKASKIKKASYPILGASFGAIAGGPVGAAVGIKAGLLVAATCAVFGYFTGRYMRAYNDGFVESTSATVEAMTETDRMAVSEVVGGGIDVADKKHI